MWFGAGFFSIRRMARRIAPLLISLRGAARKVPNFAQPIILAYETYASAKISRHSVAAWLYGVFIEKLENTYPELSGITDAPIVAFSDASHMGLMKDKMRSCTGSAIFTFHNLTQWYHGGQSIASNSTLQSELIGASTTADKAAWFFYFMESYPFLFGVKSAPSIPLFIDNQACLSVTNHPNNSTKSRHIALREFQVRIT